MNYNECPRCQRSREWHDKKCWWCGMDLPVLELPQQVGWMAVTAGVSNPSALVNYFSEVINKQVLQKYEMWLKEHTDADGFIQW